MLGPTIQSESWRDFGFSKWVQLGVLPGVHAEGTSISPRKQLQSLPEINDFGKLNRAALGRPGPIQMLAGPRSLPIRG
jgi:hypothetical protein